MVEQEAVNFEVASSSLAGGAIFFDKKEQTRSSASPSNRVWPGEPFFVEQKHQKLWPELFFIFIINF